MFLFFTDENVFMIEQLSLHLSTCICMFCVTKYRLSDLLLCLI